MNREENNNADQRERYPVREEPARDKKAVDSRIKRYSVGRTDTKSCVCL